MFADSLHYQVDLIGGDPNMALYRAMGRKQESMDIRGGMYHSLLDYWRLGLNLHCPYLCYAKVQHVSANSLCLLKQYEDLLGGRPTGSAQPDWNTFPGLDLLMQCQRIMLSSCRFKLHGNTYVHAALSTLFSFFGEWWVGICDSRIRL